MFGELVFCFFDFCFFVMGVWSWVEFDGIGEVGCLGCCGVGCFVFWIEDDDWVVDCFWLIVVMKLEVFEVYVGVQDGGCGWCFECMMKVVVGVEQMLFGCCDELFLQFLVEVY